MNDDDYFQSGRPICLRITEAAKYIGISRSYLYVLEKQGRIAFIRIGRRALVRRSELDRFISEVSAVGFTNGGSGHAR